MALIVCRNFLHTGKLRDHDRYQNGRADGHERGGFVIITGVAHCCWGCCCRWRVEMANGKATMLLADGLADRLTARTHRVVGAGGVLGAVVAT